MCYQPITKNPRITECFAARGQRRVGAMREKNEGRAELDGKSQTDIGVATEQEETVARSTCYSRENAQRHRDSKNEDHDLGGETRGAF